MPFGDDKNKELLTDLGLALGGGAGTGLSWLTKNWIDNRLAELKSWDNKTKALWENKPFKSAITDNWLQTSPEFADKLLDTYVLNAQNLASKSIGPFKAGTLVGNTRLLPDRVRQLFSSSPIPGLKESLDHYKLFSNLSASPEELKTHMLDISKDTDLLASEFTEKMRATWDKLPTAARQIIEDPTTNIQTKYNKLVQSGDKAGIGYFEDFVLGRGTHPGIAKVVGGGYVGKLDDVGKASQIALHPGFSKNYTYSISAPLRWLNTLNKFKLGGSAALAGLGLFGLGKELAKDNSLLKVASFTDDEALVPMAELVGGGGLSALGLFKTTDSLNRLAKDLTKAPNMNVGFAYGAHGGAGDGHKSPALHIRQILEKYVDSLPDGHELKGSPILDESGKVVKNEFGFNKRKGGIQFLDMGNFDHGVGPGVAADLNMIYNTGMSSAVPNFAANPGHDTYGKPTVGKFKGSAQSLRNYMTDTPYTIDLGPVSLPSFGAAVITPKRSLIPGILHGHGYDFDDVATLAYGKIPEYHQKAHSLPIFGGDIKNLAPSVVGTPFINPDTLERMNTFTTREDKLDRLKQIIDAGGPDAERLRSVYNDIKNGKKVVTVAGSGRGDYVVNRTAHLLDALDRANLDNVRVVPLMGSYTGAAKLSKADRDKLIDQVRKIDGTRGRATVFGRLNNEAYTLLQQLSDINLSATGQMGISEMANAGNLQFIPKDWRDAVRKHQFDLASLAAPNKHIIDWQNNSWLDMLGIKDPAVRARYANEIFSNSHPVLQFWNKGSMETFPEVHGDVFKTYGNTAELREGVRKYLKNVGISDASIDMNRQAFDMDGIIDLLRPENSDKLNSLTSLAESAAAKNRAKIPQAQQALIDDMVSTVKKNVIKQKLRALPGLFGGVGAAGLGAIGLLHGGKQLLDPNNFKLNLNLRNALA